MMGVDIRLTICKTRHSNYKRRSALLWSTPTCATVSNTNGPSSKTRFFPSSWSTRSAPARSHLRHTTSSRFSWTYATALVEGKPSGKHLVLGDAVLHSRCCTEGQRNRCIPGAKHPLIVLQRQRSQPLPMVRSSGTRRVKSITFLHCKLQ